MIVAQCGRNKKSQENNELRCMADELDERSAHQQGYLVAWGNEVEDNKNWKEDADDSVYEDLVEEGSCAPVWKARVDDSVQQLLSMRMGNELKERN